MLAKNDLKGKLFRNKKMKDVDFYVTNVKEDSVVGFWIYRGTRTMLYKKPDVIPFSKIVPEEWKEVIFS